MKKLLLIIFLAITLVGCQTTTTTTTEAEMSYLSFYQYHIFEVDQQLAQEESTYYIYFYGQRCGACNSIKQDALTTIELLQDDTVYFVEATKTSQIDSSIVSMGQVNYPENFGTPLMAKIVNGEVVDVFSGATHVITELHNLS